MAQVVDGHWVNPFHDRAWEAWTKGKKVLVEAFSITPATGFPAREVVPVDQTSVTPTTGSSSSKRIGYWRKHHPSHHLQLYQNTALRRPCVVSVLTIPCSHESSCSGVSGCAYFLHCPNSSGCKLFHSSVKHLSRLNEIQVFGVKSHQLRPFIIPTTSW